MSFFARDFLPKYTCFVFLFAFMYTVCHLSLILIFSISLCYNAGHLFQRTCNVGKDCRREVPGRSFKQNG